MTVAQDIKVLVDESSRKVVTLSTIERVSDESQISHLDLDSSSSHCNSLAYSERNPTSNENYCFSYEHPYEHDNQSINHLAKKSHPRIPVQSEICAKTLDQSFNNQVPPFMWTILKIPLPKITQVQLNFLVSSMASLRHQSQVQWILCFEQILCLIRKATSMNPNDSELWQQVSNKDNVDSPISFKGDLVFAWVKFLTHVILGKANLDLDLEQSLLKFPTSSPQFSKQMKFSILEYAQRLILSNQVFIEPHIIEAWFDLGIVLEIPSDVVMDYLVKSISQDHLLCRKWSLYKALVKRIQASYIQGIALESKKNIPNNWRHHLHWYKQVVSIFGKMLKLKTPLDEFPKFFFDWLMTLVLIYEHDALCPASDFDLGKSVREVLVTKIIEQGIENFSKVLFAFINYASEVIEMQSTISEQRYESKGLLTIETTKFEQKTDALIEFIADLIYALVAKLSLESISCFARLFKEIFDIKLLHKTIHAFLDHLIDRKFEEKVKHFLIELCSIDPNFAQTLIDYYEKAAKFIKKDQKTKLNNFNSKNQAIDKVDHHIVYTLELKLLVLMSAICKEYAASSMNSFFDFFVKMITEKFEQKSFCEPSYVTQLIKLYKELASNPIQTTEIVQRVGILERIVIEALQRDDNATLSTLPLQLLFELMCQGCDMLPFYTAITQRPLAISLEFYSATMMYMQEPNDIVNKCPDLMLQWLIINLPHGREEALGQWKQISQIISTKQTKSSTIQKPKSRRQRLSDNSSFTALIPNLFSWSLRILDATLMYKLLETAIFQDIHVNLQGTLNYATDMLLLATNQAKNGIFAQVQPVLLVANVSPKRVFDQILNPLIDKLPTYCDQGILTIFSKLGKLLEQHGVEFKLIHKRASILVNAFLKQSGKHTMVMSFPPSLYSLCTPLSLYPLLWNSDHHYTTSNVHCLKLLVTHSLDTVTLLPMISKLASYLRSLLIESDFATLPFISPVFLALAQSSNQSKRRKKSVAHAVSQAKVIEDLTFLNDQASLFVPSIIKFIGTLWARVTKNQNPSEIEPLITLIIEVIFQLLHCPFVILNHQANRLLQILIKVYKHMIVQTIQGPRRLIGEVVTPIFFHEFSSHEDVYSTLIKYYFTNRLPRAIDEYINAIQKTEIEAKELIKSHQLNKVTHGNSKAKRKRQNQDLPTNQKRANTINSSLLSNSISNNFKKLAWRSKCIFYLYTLMSQMSDNIKRHMLEEENLNRNAEKGLISINTNSGHISVSDVYVPEERFFGSELDKLGKETRVNDSNQLIELARLLDIEEGEDDIHGFNI